MFRANARIFSGRFAAPVAVSAWKSEIMLSLFDWENTKLPRSENKTGLPFAWVKISALKNCEGFILAQCALREAVEVVIFAICAMSGCGARKIQKFRFF